MPTIKEHIEAGHYPTDDKGRALVPHANGGTVVICATDRPETACLLGWVTDEQGEPSFSFAWSANHSDLLPPPPRKVKVVRYLMVAKHAETGPYLCPDDAEKMARAQGGVVVPLTGEYEESWS